MDHEYPPVFGAITLDEYNLRDALEKAQDELVELIRERERMDWKINKLQSDIVHLAALCRVEIEDPMAQLGLTDAVRCVIADQTYVSPLSGALTGRVPAAPPSVPMTVSDIVQALNLKYPEASEYKNLTANVQTILKRLVKSKNIATVPGLGIALGPHYIWTGGLRPLPPLPNWVKEKMK